MSKVYQASYAIYVERSLKYQSVTVSWFRKHGIESKSRNTLF